MFKVVMTVLDTFKSVVDHKTIHSKGDSVEITDVKRVNDLVKRGLAEIVSIEEATEKGADGDGGAAGGSNQTATPGKVAFNGSEYDAQVIKEALVAIGVPCAPNAGVKSLSSKVSELTDEQKTALAEKLAENKE